MPQDPAVEQLKTIKTRYEQDLMQRANVVSVGIGFKYKGGQPTDEVALVVGVSDKKPVAELAPEDVIPAEIEGIPVDVQEVGQIKAL